MKDKGIYIFIFFVFLAVIIYSCVKKPVYPSTPLIAFSNFIRYGVNHSDPDSVALSITFEDEEGDIGFAQSDTNGIFAKGNFFGILYYDSVPNRNPHIWNLWNLNVGVTQGGIPFDTAELRYRVPVVLPPNTTQPMKGIISVSIPRGSFKYGWLLHQAIYYQVYIYDEARHKSNVISTPVFVF